MTVESQVLAKLKSKEWVTSEELENLFPKGVKGHFSWPQRLRGLRDSGYIVKRRIHEGTKNLSEWKIEEVKKPEQEPVYLERKNQLCWIG